VLPEQGYHHSSFVITAANSSNLLIAATSNMNAQSRKPSQLASLFCGVTAGAVEGAITYPTEFVKTQAQFSTTKGQPVGVRNQKA
jgi:solute carrier family 25 citrate transporter 1